MNPVSADQITQCSAPQWPVSPPHTGRNTAVSSGALHHSYMLSKEVHIDGSRLVVRRVVSLALLGCHLSACSTWRMMTVPAEQALAGRPEQVRVTRAGGDRVVLINPEIVQDSLKGRRAATASPDSNGLGFPLSDVARSPS
jgi:hypothetical protein